LVAILAFSASSTQPCWSQGYSSNTSSGAAGQSTSVSFVFPKTAEHQIVQPRAAAPAPAAIGPTPFAPLSVSDYQNYVPGDWMVPHLEARPDVDSAAREHASAAPSAAANRAPSAAHGRAAQSAGAVNSPAIVAAPVNESDYVHTPAPSVSAADILPGMAKSAVERESEFHSVIISKPIHIVVPSAPAADSQANVKTEIDSVAAPISDATSDATEPSEQPVWRVASESHVTVDPSLIPVRPAEKAVETAARPAASDFPQREPTFAAMPETVFESRPEPVVRSTPPFVVENRSEPIAEIGPEPVGESAQPLVVANQPALPPENRLEDKNFEVVPPPASAGRLPMAAFDGPPTPMTTSSFLPGMENYCFRCGVKCPGGCSSGGPGWAAARPIPWEVFAQGEYIGPARLAHVPIYRLRVDDQLSFVYYLSGQVSGKPYRLNVRDRIQVQSLSAPEVVNREVIVEPDGTITLPLLGQVRAAGATLDELSRLLDDQFKRQIKDPRITVTPLVMNSNLEELRSSVDRRYGQGGLVSTARVSPDGTVQLPAIGLVPAQGLTLNELEREIKARYAQIVEGLEVTPILTDRAPRYVFVVGEVRLPGRYAMEGPTTLMQAISMAGSWNVGAGLNEVVVFRRDENWHLMATKVNIRTSLLYKKPCPDGEIWLRDSDVVLIPKSPILCADDVINLVFTRGIYGVFPMSATLNFAKLSSL
jgi:polysaccharide export outer membrane protein